MGFVSAIQHDGRMFVAGQPRRTQAKSASVPAAYPAAVVVAAPGATVVASDAQQQSVWPQMQAVAVSLWLAAKRNVLATVERAGPDVAPGQVEPDGVPKRLRPLRVLHVVDPAARGVGRMVISGRMADVCAELERLAACEARHARC